MTKTLLEKACEVDEFIGDARKILERAVGTGRRWPTDRPPQDELILLELKLQLASQGLANLIGKLV